MVIEEPNRNRDLPHPDFPAYSGRINNKEEIMKRVAAALALMLLILPVPILLLNFGKEGESR